MSDDEPQPTRIHGTKFLQALKDAGVVEQFTRRVVIDCGVQQPVLIYVEKYGDQRILSLATAFHGVEITTVGVDEVEET